MRRLVCPILLTTLLLAPVSRAQRNPAATAKDSTQGVYVRDSAVALEKFALAERMERLQEWAKSADVYQEIATTYADRVIPSLTDKENRIYQYTSVVAAVQERLAKWPAEGLTAYKTRFEPDAAALLQGAGDNRETLSKILSFYFVTDSGKQAGVCLIELYLENGEFPAAAWLGERLLQLHPGLAEERPRLIYLSSVAHALAGNADAARKSLDTLRRDFADAAGTVGGRETKYVDVLSKELDTVKPVRTGGGASNDWPMAFGSPDRSRVPSFSGFGGAKLFSIELAPSGPRLPAVQQNREQPFNVRDRSKGLMTGIFPVVDRNELYFQDNARVYAVNTESGLPLPGWAQTYDGDRRGRYVIPSATGTPRNHQNTVTLTDDSLLAVMGQPDIVAMQALGMGASTDARLVCLDRKSGKEKWTFQPKTLPDEYANLRQVTIQGSPLVVESNVYIQARGGKGGMQFEDAYVLCLELATGKLRWASYLASAGASSQILEMEVGGLVNQSISHLAYASGRIFAMTNLGALASIDAYGGSIHWLNIYPRDQISNAGFPAWTRRQRNPDVGPRPWSYNPVFISAGKVFTLPSDGSHLLVYDAASGAEVNRILLAAFPEQPDTIIGIVGEKLLLSSGKTVYCINWPKYDGKKDWRDNCTWYKTLLKPQYDDNTIAGRCFVTSEALYVPTLWALLRFEARSDNYFLTSFYPAQGKWADDEGPGNVLVTQDNLIIAGAERVTVYTDLLVATQKLDAAIAAAPNDPEPRLRYSEILFIAGKTDDAIAKLDEAVRLLGGRESMTPGASRDRVYANSVSFAQRMSKDLKDPNDSADDPARQKVIAGLYDRAAAAALTPTQQVNYRIARAGFAKSVNDSAAEVRLYQEILSDEKYRAAPTPQGSAAAVAERAIDAAIASAGRSVYQPYEDAAATTLASVPPTEPAKLMSVAQSYPNSSVAGRAMLAAAGAYESTGQPRAAIQVLRQLYSSFDEPALRSPERARVIEALVRNYLLLPGGAEVASTRLDRSLAAFAKSTLSQPIKLPGGTIVEGKTFEEAAAAVRKVSAPQSPPLPDLKLPTPATSKSIKGPRVAFAAESPQSAIDGVTALVKPLPEFVRTDRVVAVTNEGLAIFAAGAKQPIALVPSIRQAPAGCAWVSSGLVVWTDSTVTFVRDDASVAWSFDPKSVEMVNVASIPAGEVSAPANGEAAVPDAVLNRRAAFNARLLGRQRNGRPIAVPPPVADPANPNVESIGQVRPLADRVVLSTSQGRIFALDLADGAPIWQTRPSDSRPDRLIATDDFVATRLGDESAVTLTVIDAFNGAFAFRKVFTSDQGQGNLPINFTLSADGTLVYSMPDRLCALDLFEPGDKLRYGDGPPRNDAPRWFDGCTEPDHLQVSDGRIVALADTGAYVRVFSLETGRMLRGAGTNSEMVLQTRVSGGPTGVGLRLDRSRLYILGQRVLTPYDLDHPTASGWRADLSIASRDFILTPSHVVVLGMPGSGDNNRRGAGNPQPTILQMAIYSRALLKDGRESGTLAFDIRSSSISNPAGITGWQAVDGGIYYLTADNRLHFLAGAAPK